MTVWDTALILSSSVEYLSARLYNSSIVVGRSRDSEWKKRVDRPKASLEVLKDYIHDYKILSVEQLA